MTETQDLLREYGDFSPKSFLEIKGIKEELGEMKIELNRNVNPVKYTPCHLNPRFKEKVKKEIDGMLATGLIYPMDEAEWISSIVIQNKKGTDDIRVCEDYIRLKSTCVHDPFPTPFSDEVLDQVDGNEEYYFTDGFSRYLQVIIE